MPSWPVIFQFGALLNVAPSYFCCMSTLRPFSNLCIIFFILFIHVAIRVFLFSPYPYQLFGFLCNRLLVCPRDFSALVVEGSYFILVCPVLFVRLGLVDLSLKSLLYRPYLLSYLFKLFIKLVCSIFLPMFIYVFTIFSTLACHNFYTSPSSLIAHPNHLFLLGFCKETPILSLTSFALS